MSFLEKSPPADRAQADAIDEALAKGTKVAGTHRAVLATQSGTSYASGWRTWRMASITIRASRRPSTEPVAMNVLLDTNVVSELMGQAPDATVAV